MKPRRRPSRRLSDHTFGHTLQTIRLEAIARGEQQPRCLREECFQRHLQHHGRARIADFIVPWPLLRVEAIEMRVDREDAGIDDEPCDTLSPTASTSVPDQRRT